MLTSETSETWNKRRFEKLSKSWVEVWSPKALLRGAYNKILILKSCDIRIHFIYSLLNIYYDFNIETYLSFIFCDLKLYCLL